MQKEMNIDFVVEFITNNGFPVFLVLCYLYILYYVWKFVNKELKPALINILETLNKLNSKAQEVCNDVDKLNQKVTVITVIKKPE